MTFEGRTVIVTGGASGIGRTTAIRFAERGASVVVFDRAARRADGVAGEPGAGIGSVRAFEVDVTDGAAVIAAVGRVVDAFGPIDVLVNGAAVAREDDLLTIDEPGWAHEIDVALTGSYRCARAVLPSMISEGHGVIVNVGSVNGIAAYGQEAYSAAKAGIESLTRSIAVRYGPLGVRAVTVAPGTVVTPAWDERVRANPGVFVELARWYPLGRVGTPDDVAAAILFLASDEAGWITGTTLVVDGGLLAGGYRMLQEAVGKADRVEVIEGSEGQG